MSEEAADAETEAEAATGPSRIDRTQERLEKIRLVQTFLRVFGLALVIGIAYVGLGYLNFDPDTLNFEAFFDSVSEFLNPDFHFLTLHSIENDLHGWNALIQSLLNPGTFWETLVTEDATTTIVRGGAQTIVIGLVGTILGFPLALTFGVLGSERVTPFPFNFIFRGVMSTIRAVPALVWVLIYVPLQGITPVTAMLAVGTDTIGNLGRLFTDELEEIDEGPIEAISSTGASGSQTVVFGMLSQVSTSFIAWTLYILEINVRIAVSLGVVGAGGIGQYVDGRIGLFDFNGAAAGIFAIIVIVLSVELLSSRLRARLRPGEGEAKSLSEAIVDLGDSGKWVGAGTDPKS